MFVVSKNLLLTLLVSYVQNFFIIMSCSALNSSASKKCTTCGVTFDKRGRPNDTKASDGYLVGTSGGRPTS